MLTIKVRTTHNNGIDTWNTFSALQHKTDFDELADGGVDQFMDIQDSKENWHRVYFETNVAIFVENQNGRTVEKHNYTYPNTEVEG